MLQLLIAIMASSSGVLAEDFKRFEFQPFWGFTASGSIPLKAKDDISYGSVHVDSSFNIGATLAININDSDAIETRW